MYYGDFGSSQNLSVFADERAIENIKRMLPATLEQKNNEQMNKLNNFCERLETDVHSVLKSEISNLREGSSGKSMDKIEETMNELNTVRF